ncbi:hypothetical protein ACOTWR_06420 [Aliarcobacter butzleri]
MATSVSMTSDEFSSILAVIDFVEHNADGREDCEDLINSDLERLRKLVRKFSNSNIRTACRNELKKHGANSKENVNKMVAEMRNNMQ